jgi:pimeloyl-ACP methyl ester carboxylesterase
MYPGSGPSDRDNDIFFPPIRRRLLDAGIAVVSFDKRGVGNSGGSWLEIGIEEQAADLLAGHAAAAALVPGVPGGVFGHSQGGWVVLEALRMSRDAASFAGSPAFGVTSSGPGVTMADQERFAAVNSVTGITADRADRERALGAAWTVIGMFEAGRAHPELMAWANEPGNTDDLELVKRLYGDDLLDVRMWDHLVRLAGFDPIPALEAIDVPLLAVFGSRDTVTPVEPSVAAFTAHVAAHRLQIAVIPDGNHRLQLPDSTDFARGYPDVIIDFVTALTA